MKKIIKTTILTLAAVLTFAGAANINTIHAEAATKTTTSTSVRKTKKVVKLKKKAKTKTTKKIATKKNTKKTSQRNVDITKVTTVKTTTVTKYKAKKKTIDTTVQTTVQTTTVTKETQKTTAAPAGTTSAGTTAAANETAKTTTTTTTPAATSMNIDSLSGTVSPMIIKAFKTMNYEIVINSGVSYAGYFDGKNQRITLRSANTGYLLHEVGHYVAFITGFKDSTAEFKSIYAKEVSKYTGTNKAYVTQSSEEYFAESFRDYYTNKTALKSARPETCEYIEKCIAAVTDARINYVNAIYYS